VAWKNKPSWYQISTADRMIAPQNQQWMAERLNAREILTLNASHASLASMPAEVAALIDRAATALANG
jgi:pimeloyl-ACP methyl ester carboxylesterase